MLNANLCNKVLSRRLISDPPYECDLSRDVKSAYARSVVTDENVNSTLSAKIPSTYNVSNHLPRRAGLVLGARAAGPLCYSPNPSRVTGPTPFMLFANMLSPLARSLRVTR
jgi:hypothetical protein